MPDSGTIQIELCGMCGMVCGILCGMKPRQCAVSGLCGISPIDACAPAYIHTGAGMRLHPLTCRTYRTWRTDAVSCRTARRTDARDAARPRRRAGAQTAFPLRFEEKMVVGAGL